jgi:hypothetical protein
MFKVTHSKNLFMVECRNFLAEVPAILNEAYDNFNK